MEDATHIMIDLETLGTSERAAVVQIGVAAFELDGSGPIVKAQWDIDLDSTRRLGGVVDDGTIRWWMKQSDEARRAVFVASETCTSMEEGLYGLRQFWANNLGKFVWSHGSAFDVAILEGYYRRVSSVPAPWKFWNVRDTRTLFALAEQVAGWRRPKVIVAHEAVADAVQQALDVQSAWAALKGIRSPEGDGLNFTQ